MSQQTEADRITNEEAAFIDAMCFGTSVRLLKPDGSVHRIAPEDWRDPIPPAPEGYVYLRDMLNRMRER